MKQILLLSTLFAAVLTGTAQPILRNVPANATAVIRYSGENFAQKMPVSKLESYKFIKGMLTQSLRIDSFTSFNQMGVDLTRDACQYVLVNDSTASFVTILYLKDPNAFSTFLKKAYRDDLKLEEKSGFRLVKLSSDFFAGWNDSMVVFTATSYTRYESYSEPASSDSAYAVVAEAPKTEVTTDEIVEIAPPPPPPPAHQQKGKKKPATKAHKPAPKKPVVKGTLRSKKKPVIRDEEVVVAEKPSEEDRIRDSIRQAHIDFFYQQQDMKREAAQRKEAESIIGTQLNSLPANSIATSDAWKKVIAPAAQVNLWFDYDNVLSLYWNAIFSRFTPGKSFYGSNDSTGMPGFRSGINMYFDKDQLRMETRMYTADPAMSKMGTNIYQSRQSAGMLNYINPDHLALLSISNNTQASINYTYTLLRRYLTNTPFMKEYSDVVDVYIDLLETLVDEKGISDLIPGNYLFILHGLQQQETTFTDYEYDSNFNRTEVKKTKKEMMPDFTFAFETRREDFMKKVAKLPLKFAEKEKIPYKQIGDYFVYEFEPGKYPLRNLYFIVKNGRVVITTSKDALDVSLNNGSLNPDTAIRNLVSQHNYLFHINTSRVLEKVKSEIPDGRYREVAEYLDTQMGDIQMKSFLDGDVINGISTIKIKGDHSNSFEAIFNMIEGINKIMERREEADKKVLQ